MILTLYYMYATLLQWWKLGNLKNKLNGTLNSQNALLVCQEKIMFETKKQKSIENLLFKNNTRIACTVVPKQKINLSSQWLTFPKNFKNFPIYFNILSHKLQTPYIYVIVQANLENYVQFDSEVLQLEKFGELIAWKAIDTFDIILKTDMDKLTKLVNCFSYNDCDINHELQLLKIETINIEGNATKIKYDRKFSQKYSRNALFWQTFVGELKNIYAKIHDVNNPKITIENGKIEEVKKVPISEVKPIKKDLKKNEESKNTLDVGSSVNRRHKDKKEREKSAEKHKKKEGKVIKEKCEKKVEKAIEKEKKCKKELPKNTKTLVDKKEPKPSTSKEKIRSNSKEKKLVKSNAICDENLAKVEKPDLKKIIDNIFLDETNNFNIKNHTFRPPNILVYADTQIGKENIKNVLKSVINNQKYVLYDLPLENPSWMNSTTLIVISGNVPSNLTFYLMNFLLHGGQLLCLCSDLLYSVLHNFTTAEVRENELVRFSYKDWKQVKMMHHIFCYQASPAKKQFSKDSDTTSNHSGSGNGSSPVAPRTPSTVEIMHNNNIFVIQVQILGTEETWQTPSLILADVKSTNGRAVFSQVHLEINPTQYEDDENKFEALKESNNARIEILKDILQNHLDIDCSPNNEINYTPAYFLGRHDLKLEMLNNSECIKNKKITMGDFTAAFLAKDETFDKPNQNFLPILIHLCPLDFSTVNYFETLNTLHIGRLVIYSNMMTSSQKILTDNVLAHGLVVIPKQQTEGIGRNNNIWLSPMGCAMFSVQLHVSMVTALGNRLGLVQHLAAVSVVDAIKKLTSEDIDINIKWPNDIYAFKNVKIGGIVVTSSIMGQKAIVNIGIGLNLNNKSPTTCVNEIIRQHNLKNDTKFKEISFETYFATVFNEMEQLFDICQKENVEKLYELYYKYWLHSDNNVTVMSDDKTECQKSKILGIDDYGFLKVRLESGEIKSVQPDGNTFDMMRGLIYPKKY